MPSPRSGSRALVRLLVVAFAVGVGGAGAEPLLGRTSDAQRLTFLLEYVGTDYADAVRDGKVANEVEYGEVLRVEEEAAAGAERPEARLAERVAVGDDRCSSCPRSAERWMRSAPRS